MLASPSTSDTGSFADADGRNGESSEQVGMGRGAVGVDLAEGAELRLLVGGGEGSGGVEDGVVEEQAAAEDALVELPGDVAGLGFEELGVSPPRGLEVVLVLVGDVEQVDEDRRRAGGVGVLLFEGERGVQLVVLEAMWLRGKSSPAL